MPDDRRPEQQAQAFLADGVTPIKEEDLEVALETGQANFRPADRVIMKRGGVTEVVTGADVGKYLGAGYAVELPSTQAERTYRAKYRTTPEFGRALVESGAAGLTAGLSDLALVGLGADPKAMRTRREEAATYTTAAQIAGAVAPAFVTGGSSLAARGLTGIGRAGLAAGEAAGAGVARTLGGGLGARVAGGVVGGAVEGALFGAGQGVSDAVLNEVDPEDFAEKVLASAGTGALLGGVLGGAGGALTRKAAKGPFATEALEEAGERAAKSEARAFTDIPTAMDSAREAAAVTRGGPRAIKAIETGAGGIAEKLTGMPFAKPVVDVARKVEGAARLGGEIAEGVAGNASMVDKAIVRAVSGADAKLLAEAERIGEASLASTTRKHGLLGFSAEKQATQAAKLADDGQATLRQIAETADKAGAKVDAARFMSDVEDQITTLRQIDDTEAKKLADQLSAKVDPIRSQVAKGKEYSVAEWSDLRNRFDKGIKWDKLASEGKSTSEFRDILNRFDEGTESALSQEQKQLWRTTQRETRDLEFLARSMQQQAKKQAAEGDLLSLQTLMGGEGGALGIGAIGGLMTGAPLAGIAIGAGKNVVNKAIQRYGDVFKAKLLDVASGADLGLGRAATSLVQGAKAPLRVSATYDVVSQPDPTKLEGKKLSERFSEAEAEVRELQDPEVMAQRMSRNIEALDTHPAVAAALMTQAQRAVDYLGSLLPTPLADEYSLTPHLEDGHLHPEQMQQFLSAKWGIDSPFSVIDGLSDGNINWDAIRAVKAVYPKLFTRLQELAVQEAMTRKEPLEYNQRVLLGLALDLPAEETLRPDVLSRIQAAKFLPPEEAEESIPGPKPRRGIDVSAQYALPNPE